MECRNTLRCHDKSPEVWWEVQCPSHLGSAIAMRQLQSKSSAPCAAHHFSGLCGPCPYLLLGSVVVTEPRSECQRHHVVHCSVIDTHFRVQQLAGTESLGSTSINPRVLCKVSFLSFYTVVWNRKKHMSLGEQTAGGLNW